MSGPFALEAADFWVEALQCTQHLKRKKPLNGIDQAPALWILPDPLSFTNSEQPHINTLTENEAAFYDEVFAFIQHWPFIFVWVANLMKGEACADQNGSFYRHCTSTKWWKALLHRRASSDPALAKLKLKLNLNYNLNLKFRRRYALRPPLRLLPHR